MKYRNTLLAIFAAALVLTVGIALALPAIAQDTPPPQAVEVTTFRLLDIRNTGEGFEFDLEELKPTPRKLTLLLLDVRKVDGGLELEAEVQDAR